VKDTTLENPAPSTPTPAGASPRVKIPGFDFDALRIGQDFSELAATERVVTAVPLGKPNRHSFIRVHEDPMFRVNVFTLTLKSPNEMYLVLPEVAPALQMEIKPTMLQLAVTSQAVPFIWPLRLPGPDGREDIWMSSALSIRALAENHWVRMTANLFGGYYDAVRATADLGDPRWPDMPFDELVRLAFNGDIIDSLNHPVVQTRILGTAK